MNESYTKVTNTSYLDNIKNSIFGVIIGIVLFIASFVVLWMNEGNCVKQIDKANYIEKNAIEIESNNFNEENNNLLIATNGTAVVKNILSDGILDIENALVLDRNVEMYQWVEDKKTETKDNMGGSTTTTTTYTYSKKWSSTEHDSTRFEKSGYDNPPFEIESKKYSADSADFGQFFLDKEQIYKIKANKEFIDLPYSSKYSIVDGKYYSGDNYNKPQIGDLRISYTYAPSGTEVSIIGQQNPNYTISPLKLKKGNIYLQYNGLFDKEEMVNKFKTQNTITTFIFRFVGWLLMFIGLNLIINPIITVLKIIPVLANIANFLTGIILFLISLILSLLTVAIAWFAYRPLMAIMLLIIIAGLIYLIKISLSKNKKITP